MMQAVTWSREQVRALLMASEGSASPHGANAEGHAGSSHVSLSNAGMQQKAQARRGMISASSAFLCFADQISAGLQVLNSVPGKGAVEFLLSSARIQARVIIEGRVHALRVRWSNGHHNWTQESFAACMILDKRTGGINGIHLQTLFPIDSFRHDCPTWWCDEATGGQQRWSIHAPR